MNRCASSACSGRGCPAGTDRPDGLVRDHEVLAPTGREGERLDLDLEDELGVARLALLERLADTGDHAQSFVERCPCAPRHHLVRLAEELAALRVADERARDTELAQHRRRDLAGVCALRLPVDVLRVDLRAALDGDRERGKRRAEDDVDALGRLEGLEERARLRRPLEHLPVAGDQHQPEFSGIAATPGSSLPSSSSSEAPPPVETQEISSASPSSLTARTESPPPTTV